MSDVRYYADEHVPKAVDVGLRARGVDVQSTAEAGGLGASDDAQLAFALSHGRVMATHVDDYLGLAARGALHAGIAYAPEQTSVGEIIRGLMLISRVLSAEKMIGNIEFI